MTRKAMRRCEAWLGVRVLLLSASMSLAGPGVLAAEADRAARPSWGAIAAANRLYGYSFDHATRGAAEAEALAQCERRPGRREACALRSVFDRSCGALAAGNYGEWATATAPTAAAAGAEAKTQCDNHLPTEPCTVVVSVCSRQRP